MNRRSALALPLAFAAVPGFVSAEGAARLRIAPSTVLEGDPVSIRVTGLSAGERVTLCALSRDAAGHAQFAQASFLADAHGVVDLATSAPRSGSYTGADLRGLFWSRRPVDASSQADADRWRPAAPLESGQVLLGLERGGQIGDQARLTLNAADPDVVREEVRADGLVGSFHVRRGAVRRPCVIILGGAEGGRFFGDWLGPRLASRGYACLGIAYFSADGSIAGIPNALEHIPVELADRARTWLAARPEADIDRFGVVGASKGGEFALLIAATYSWVKATVAYVPADYVWQGFSYGSGEAGAGSSWSKAGKDIPFIPEAGLRDVIVQGRRSGGGVRLAPVHEANFQGASAAVRDAARIRVEQSRSAFLLVGGEDDQTAGSGAIVTRAAALLKANNYSYPVDAVNYPGAGHLIVDTGWNSTIADNTGLFHDGGTPAADARAQADGWLRMIRFLEKHL